VVVDRTAAVLSVGAKGLGKRSAFDEYRITNRGGLGIISMKVSERTGDVVALKAVREGDDLMMMTEHGMVVRIAVETISMMGRSTQGVKLISVREGDRVVAVTPVVKEDTEGEAPRVDLEVPNGSPTPETVRDTAGEPIEPVPEDDAPEDDAPEDDMPEDE
jgi:DNA gyrase subunit A